MNKVKQKSISLKKLDSNDFWNDCLNDDSHSPKKNSHNIEEQISISPSRSAEAIADGMTEDSSDENSENQEGSDDNGLGNEDQNEEDLGNDDFEGGDEGGDEGMDEGDDSMGDDSSEDSSEDFFSSAASASFFALCSAHLSQTARTIVLPSRPSRKPRIAPPITSLG